MAGAVAVGAIAFALVRKRPHSYLGAPLRMPELRDIDRALVFGSLAFGAGWGLAGYCPGPALASLASGGAPAWIFSVSMLAGMFLFEILKRK